MVAGGGAVESALSVYLEYLATTLGSREQLAIAEFAESLLIIPKVRVKWSFVWSLYMYNFFIHITMVVSPSKTNGVKFGFLHSIIILHQYIVSIVSVQNNWFCNFCHIFSLVGFLSCRVYVLLKIATFLAYYLTLAASSFMLSGSLIY